MSEATPAVAELARRVESVVDAHVHLYDPGSRRHPWLVNVPAIDSPHLLPDYREASSGYPIEALVFVEVAPHDDDGLDEAAWVQSLADTDSLVGAIVAQARVERGAAVADELAELSRHPAVTGVRRIIAAPFQSDPDLCVSPRFVEGVKAVGAAGLVFDLGLSAVDLPNAIRLAERCPDVQFVLDHAGKPLIEAGAVEPWREHVGALASLGNVTCKVSGLLTEAGPAWEASAIAPYVREVIELFGFGRVMFGSDFPVQNLVGSYAGWIDAAYAAVSDARDDELAQLFRMNARRVYRLDRKGADA
jgi:L-fuconolactonase